MYLGSYGKCAQFTKPALLPDSIMRCSYKDSLFKYCKCFYIDLFLSQLAYFLAGDQGIMHHVLIQKLSQPYHGMLPELT